jgi:16S rRNA (uracil1498-N3)-methyltransferase
MRIPRIYVAGLTKVNDCVTLEGQAAKHLLQVLRVKPGQPVVIFDGGGTEYHAEVLSAARGSVEARIISKAAVSRESNLSITLVQAISRGERMDWVLQKATELGVVRIIPVFSKRSMVKLDQKRLGSRIDHWQAVLAHACEQSGRNRLPELAIPMALTSVMDELPAASDSFYLEPDCDSRFRQLRRSETVNLFVGPEGGFDPEEKVFMTGRGVKPVYLGPRILRTETAGIAAIAALGVLWGDM